MKNEKNRIREHFQRLISLIQLSSLKPFDLQFYQETYRSVSGLPMYNSTNVMLNRLTAEITRKHTYASVFSGPISNSPEFRQKYSS